MLPRVLRRKALCRGRPPHAPAVRCAARPGSRGCQCGRAFLSPELRRQPAAGRFHVVDRAALQRRFRAGLRTGQGRAHRRGAGCGPQLQAALRPLHPAAVRRTLVAPRIEAGLQSPGSTRPCWMERSSIDHLRRGRGRGSFDDCVPEWSAISRDTLAMSAADFVQRETRPELAGPPQGRMDLG